MPSRTTEKSRRRRPKVPSGGDREPTRLSTIDNYSKPIGRALEALDCFEDGFTTLSLVEISKRKGFPESSLFRSLVTLEAHGYLIRSADGAYQLAPKLLFGKLYDRAHKIRDLVRPFLKELNILLNETVSMGYLFQDRIEVVDTLEAIQELRRTNTLGRVLPPHCSSIGKAILAFQERSDVERILRINGLSRRTDKTITDHVQLLQEFERIRANGYSVDREESVPGGICFGAPLYDGRLKVVAAISSSAPLFRVTPEREPEIIRVVMETAQAASKAIIAATPHAPSQS